MILLYSGAARAGENQTLPTKSLGGYVSSSPIGNASLNNLFGSIAVADLLNDIDCKCIYIYNETTSDMIDIEFFYIYQSNNQATVQISAVTPSIDQNGCPFVEMIPNGSSSPYNANFIDASSAYENGIMIITHAGAHGEIISIFNGATVLCNTDPLSPATPTIADTVAAIVNAMTGNADFSAITVLNTTDQILFTNLLIGNFGSVIELETSGVAYAANVTLSGGSDQSVNIGTIVSKQYLALWLKRTINAQIVIDQNTQVVDNQVIPGDRPSLSAIIPQVPLPTKESINFHFKF